MSCHYRFIDTSYTGLTFSKYCRKNICLVGPTDAYELDRKHCRLLARLLTEHVNRRHILHKMGRVKSGVLRWKTPKSVVGQEKKCVWFFHDNMGIKLKVFLSSIQICGSYQLD